MKTNNLILTALTALMLTALAGCSSETDLTRTDDVSPLIPAGMTQLSFDIKGVRSGTSYVALTQDEAQLKDLCVLLFPQSEDGPNPDAVCVAALKAKITTKDGVYKAAVLLDKTIPVGKYYATLMANMAALIGPDPGNFDLTDEEWKEYIAGFIGQTYTKVFTESIASFDRGKDTPPIADYGLGMKALVKDIDVTEADRGDVILLSATLARIKARFDIKNTAYKSFTITGYRTRNIRGTAFIRFLDIEVPALDYLDDSDPVTLTEAQKTLLNTPSLDDDGNPDTPPVMTYNPAFYCLPGEVANQSYVEITGELKTNAGGTRTITYTIPLKTKVPDEYIAIQSNKRYKIELKMTETEQLEGDVTMDAGSWDDEGGTGTGNDNIEEQLPGEIRSVTGATYDETDKTFHVVEGVNTFSFTFIVSVNTLRAAATTPGIVSKVEEATTLVVPSAKYTVTLAATGNTGAIEEIGKDKDGKEVVVNTYTVKREAKISDIYPPTNTKATLVGNVYWAPVDLGATKPDEPGYLYQYGRMKGWKDAETMNNAKVANSQITIDDADKYPDEIYKDPIGMSEYNWWLNTESQENINALIARWSAVSNGTNNPCPEGWRLPTEAEVNALLAGQNPTYSGYIMNVRGLLFHYDSNFSSMGDAHVDAGYYWLSSTYEHTISIQEDSIEIFESSEGSANGCYIRCVKPAY